ncbi:insulinase family protein [Paenibacillus wynnii]|uniref:Peptidase M16 N-terminal domain-containing protein n=1 Tax=Paenibacillus wynnii TaxID=268407 RepID=A0A098MB72_9BACL|nr:insulinase family protein [Paenibacillus wynnii]KGE19794.1 hypothetical protein PWYN_10930 [Paenibacillus wynnii]
MGSQGGISSLRIVFPIGSKDDPNGKEGLTHLLEHVVMKANVKGCNLIELSSTFGFEVRAMTSKEYLCLEFEGSRWKFIRFYESFVKFMALLGEYIDLNDDFLMKEKSVIRSEMKFKFDQLSRHERVEYFAERWKWTRLEHSVLGSEASLEVISVDDLTSQLKSLTLSYPEIMLIHNDPADREKLEELTAEFVNDRVMVSGDEYQKVLYSLVTYIAKENNIKHVEADYYGSIGRLKLSFPARQQLINLHERQIIDAIKVFPGNPYIKKDLIETLINGNPEFLLKEFFALLNQIMINVTSHPNNLDFNPIKDMGVVGNHRWCLIKNMDNFSDFAAVSILPDRWIRKRLKGVTNNLLCYLHSVSPADIKVNCEIGLISVYISGTANQVMEAVNKILQFNTIEAQSFFHNGSDKRVSGHSLSLICDHFLHSDSIQDYSQSVVISSQELLNCLTRQIREGVSIVTSINNKSYFMGHLSDDQPNHLTDLEVPLNRTEERSIASLLLATEYIEVWPGSSVFSPQKYLSHTLWSMIAGIDGEMFREFTLEQSKSYSHTFFPRELYHFGYRILYVHCSDSGLKYEIGPRFREMLNKLRRNLDMPRIEMAKEKVRIRRERINDSLAQRFIYLSAYLLNHTNTESFFNYEAELSIIQPDTLKTYISQMIDSSTNIFGLEGI